MKKRTYIAALSSVVAVVLAVVIALNGVMTYWDSVMTQFFGVIGEGTSSSENVDSEYFKNTYATQEELLAVQEDFTLALSGEAMVLLKNDDALPLSSGAKVSLFGIAAVGGTSSGSGSGGGGGGAGAGVEYTWKSSLTRAGFSVNEVLADFYANSGHVSGKGTAAGSGVEMGDWSIDEVPQNEFTSDVLASYSSYHDAAIVVFARIGGEGGDLAMEMSRHGGHADKNYLELSDEEEDLLKAIKDAGFEKTIVVINSANPMELGFVDYEEYGVDACLWTGGTGVNGIDAFGMILSGEINPSGRLVDTYVYDNFSSPAMQNFGDFRYVDDSGNLLEFSYLNYGEGIYTGYRYYETRYEDVVMGTANAGTYDYASTVKYPFGYGLSYTTFEFSDYDVAVDGDKVTVSVKVTNTGSSAGKEVVQIYFQSPYTEYDVANQIEKSAVSLVEFAKTGVIEAGASETVSVSFSLEEMKSYDSMTEKTYILEAGDYYITAADNAHSAINNILAAKGYSAEENNMTEDGDSGLVYKHEVSETVKYDTSVTGAAVTNHFDDAAAPDYTYLTRSNWAMMDDNGLRYATGKVTGVSNVTDADKSAGTIVPDAEILAVLRDETAAGSGAPLSSTSYPSESEYTYGAGNGVELIDLMGKDYDDALWDDLLDEMKNSEMHALFGKGGYGTAEIESIAKPKTLEYDGPAGIANFVTGESAFSFPSEIMLASSWNKELASEYGRLLGEDAIRTKTAGWYAPAANLHRTPFSGRNYEYYSEDPVLSGLMMAEEIMAVQEKGVFVYMKHFALNDQETNRGANGNVAIWATEQTIREIYLKPFQYGVERADARGIMCAMNRIGARRAYGSYALLTEVARGEWGFKGIMLTDFTSVVSPGLADQFLAAGMDMFLSTAQCKLTDAKLDWCRAGLRRAAHNVLYAQANSLAMNGLSHGTVYNAGIAKYKIALLVVDIVAAAGIAYAGYLIVRAARMTPEGFMDRKKWSKRTHIIVWSVTAAIVVILIVVFCITYLPIIRDALLI